MKFLTSLLILAILAGSVLLGVGLSWLSARGILNFLNKVRNSKK